MCVLIRFNCFEFTDFELEGLAAKRSGEEIRMHVNDVNALLPVQWQGRNQLLPWGSKGQSRLPKTGFCKVESLAAGKWAWLNPEEIHIIASFGWANGVWFQVRQAVKGIVVRSPSGTPHCYMLTQPATHYFKIMTGAERMPVLVNQIL